MRIAIIVVSYNKKNLLEKCLKSLGEVKYDDFQVILVDNGSMDESCQMVAGRFPEVHIIEMGYNSGFCKANNVGTEFALNNNFDGILLLNNDTEVDPDFLGEMVKNVNDNERVGMVAAKILFMSNPEIIDSTGLVITPDGLAKNKGLGENGNEHNVSCEVFCPAGAAALYTKNLLLDIKRDGQYLDEKYQYYFEELDLGWRARLKGWKCIYAPRALVYHCKSATSGAYSEFIAFHTNRNIFYTIIKNYHGYFFCKAMALSLFRFPVLLFGFILNKGPGKKINEKIGFLNLIKVTLLGFKDVVVNLSDMLQKRKEIEVDMNVSRKEIRRWFKDLGLSFFDSVYR